MQTHRKGNRQVTPEATPPNHQSATPPSVRGKLRIYFGASSGVGKTFAMLDAARKMKADNRDIVIGIVETHGCSKTSALCDGIEILSAKVHRNNDRTYAEFDLDAALQRRPAYLLLDDLAHSNLPDARHPQRWQDVEELINAGINVFTSIDVQHLESLNTVAGDITGSRVTNTVPDTVFDAADEIILVDIPVDELCKRMESRQDNDQRPMHKGDLIALRELALRRTAERVEDDVLAYRAEESVKPVWKTDAALLACIGPQSDIEHVIRSAARLANQLNSTWHAVYVETPRLARLPSEQRERILKNLKLAQDLGASTAVLSGNDVALAIADYAGLHNFSKIIIGRSQAGWRRIFSASHHARIVQFLPSIDLVETGRITRTDPTKSDDADLSAEPLRQHDENIDMHAPSRWRGYAIAAGASLLTALISIPLLRYLELANIVMLFLLTVVLVAVRLRRGASVVATLVSVAALILESPRFSFGMGELEYMVTLVVMLAVGLITGKLTADLRYQARVAAHRETRAVALFKYARALSGTLQTEQISDTTMEFIHQTFHCKAALLLPDATGRLHLPRPSEVDASKAPHLNFLDAHIAQWAFDHAKPAGHGTDTLSNNPFFYLPLLAPMHTRGVLAIQPDSARWVLIPEQRRQLDTFAALTAIALERVHYVDVAQEALLKMESERLRNSLLAALSHDLRTPLTSLVGLSEALAMSKPSLTSQQLELADALRSESTRMSNLVSNLLEMARIQSGQIKLNLQWQTIEEVTGTALRICHSQLQSRQISIKIKQDLPLIQFDAVLIERVLCNLLENAAKYTPPTALIEITAEVEDVFLSVMVCDNGSGLPVGREEILFEKFTRGDNESAIPGIGLGLAICRAIIEAHGGTIRATKSDLGGASFIFTLPLGTPPDISSLDENETLLTQSLS
ncbi:MAG TPA: ATP-binding protein [Burkholderiaceae bacterium]|jgi:two-component system sensor histidine kinase KdpD